MGRFRRVSSSDLAEAIEAHVVASVDNLNGTYGITVTNISSWPDEIDCITYARNPVTGDLDEQTRTVWTGVKDDSTHVTVSRVGGPSLGDNLDSTYFITVVPTHVWANNIVDALSLCLPDDGANGVKAANGTNLAFVVSSTQPSPIANRTLVWLRPL
jgi:hypothetical protein